MFIRIKDVDIHYEIFGESGKPLLLLHGWMANINAMAPIWQYFKEKRRVYVIDFPGQGGGTKEPPMAWNVAMHAEMVATFIEKLDLAKVDVIGHSFGGRVSIYLASHFPQLVDKVILTDSAGIKPKFNLKRWIKIRSYKFAKMLLKAFNKKEAYEQKLAKLRQKRGSSDYNNISSDIMRQTFNSVVNEDLTKYLKDIKAPTLLVWGEQDKDTPLYMAKKMERHIKDSGVVTLKGAGHFSYIDASFEYNKIVENFIGG